MGNIRSSFESNPEVGRPVPSKKRVRAMYNFEAINEDDLSFKKGDLMEIDDATSESEHWWFAIHLTTKKRGKIPRNYVISVEIPPHQTQDWWFNYDRRESEKMLLLAENPQGTFLVRPSRFRVGNSTCVLSVRHCDIAYGDPYVKHYRIRILNKRYFFSVGKTFPTIVDLISHHRDSSDGLCCRLTTPCPRIRPVVQFRELEISRDNVRLSTKLGAGCFGEVWKGTLNKMVDVAVRILQPGNMSSQDLLNLTKTMHCLTHQRLVQLLGVVSVEEPFYIISELMINGALLDFLRSETGKRQQLDTLMDMNSQIAEGMSYLEKVNFVHRNLRAANVLVGEHFEMKVADFGLARILEFDQIYQEKENSKITIKWTAPEAALERKFSVKSDVWSFGVLMYEIITFGKVPYPGMRGAEVLAKVERGFRMEKPVNGAIDVPDSYFDMMLKCWHKVPEQRPTFESLHDLLDNFFC